MGDRTARTSRREGRHVLLTGATGFVGQAVLERLLSDPTRPQIWLLIRAHENLSAAERLEQLLRNPAFRPWRARIGERHLATEIATRVHLLEGDLLNIPTLPTCLDTVIHAASTVKFDAPLPLAFDANVGGPAHLYEALDATGSSPHVIHISTSFVNATRVHNAHEVPLDHDLNWREELITARRTTREVHAHSASERRDPAWTARRLRELGRLSASERGWTDVYTLTKALGESVAQELWSGRGHRLTVIRPTIIESAYSLPFPGWIDGFKVADPLIGAFAKGRFNSFPGSPDAILDIIPVDYVTSTIMGAMTHRPRTDSPIFLQVGSGNRNPITLQEFSDHVQQYLIHHPWTFADGTSAPPQLWRFVSPTLANLKVRLGLGLLTAAGNLLKVIPAQWGARMRARIGKTHSSMQRLLAYMRLYEPYTSSTTRYHDDAMQLLHQRLTSDPDTSESMCLQTDSATIQWSHYLHSVHMPSLLALMHEHECKKQSVDPVPAVEPESLPVVAATPRTTCATCSPTTGPLAETQAA